MMASDKSGRAEKGFDDHLRLMKITDERRAEAGPEKKKNETRVPYSPDGNKATGNEERSGKGYEEPNFVANLGTGTRVPYSPEGDKATGKEERNIKGCKEPNFVPDLLTASVLAAVSKTALAPFERAKLLLQLQAAPAHSPAERRYKGIIDVLARVPKEQGFSALWRGNLANVTRYMPKQALNFAFYDMYRNMFYKGVDYTYASQYVTRNAFAGAAAGATTLCFVYPLDYARTRLAADVGKRREFKDLADCLIKTVKADGPRGLYRGFFGSLPVVTWYRAFYFGLFDMAKTRLERDGKPLNFFKAWLLAQVTTVATGISTVSLDMCMKLLTIEQQSGSKKDLKKYAKDWALKQKNDTGFVKANFLRSTGGALVLAGYSEIQSRRSK